LLLEQGQKHLICGNLPDKFDHNRHMQLLDQHKSCGIDLRIQVKCPFKVPSKWIAVLARQTIHDLRRKYTCLIASTK